MISRKFNYHFYYLVLIVLITTLAHFVPFERASLAPDDYAFLLMEKEGLGHFLTSPHRPLQYLWAETQNIFIGDNSQLGLFFVYLSSTITILLCYWLISLFTKDKVTIFLITLVYSVLFIKLEIYQYPGNVHVNLSTSIYILSLIFFLIFIRSYQNAYLAMSISSYSIAVFWYEVGFFIPIAMFTYYFLVRENNKKITDVLKIFLPFLFVVFFYSVYRITGGFGATEWLAGRQVSISTIPQGIVDVFHHFFGRYFVRNIIYGLYKFPDISTPWLAIISFLNIISAFAIYRIFQAKESLDLSRKQIVFFLVLFFVSIIPNVLVGAVGGRNVIIASIPFVVFIYLILNLLSKKITPYAYTLLFVFSLVICQGNAWNQVMASRINGSVYEYLKERRQDMLTSDIIIIDTNSFAENIDYTMVKREFNTLNTYYGAQAFESWGLTSMVHLVLGDLKDDKEIIISVESPKLSENGNLIVVTGEVDSYRSVKKTSKEINPESPFFVNFNKVFPQGFNKGKRIQLNN
tara:strand:- start:15 stop:1571 length:1557 start_codon:yes stop_codon:yes gene_type:complete